jgi:hypothetical protein
MLMREFRSLTALGRITRDDCGAPVAVYAAYRLAVPAGALQRR